LGDRRSCGASRAASAASAAPERGPAWTGSSRLRQSGHAHRTRRRQATRALLVTLTLAACAGLIDGSAHATAAITLTRVSDDAFTAYAEPAIAADPTHPARMLAASQAVPASAPDGSRRQLVTFLTSDGAHTWHANGPLPGSTPALLGLDVTTAYDSRGTAYVLGEEQRPTGGAPVLLWRSSDGGRTFARPITVAKATAGRGGCCDHSWLSIDAHGVLHVVYTGDGGEVFATRSLDRGDHWSAALALGEGDSAVIATGGHGIVAELDDALRIRVSHDGARTFATEHVLAAGRTSVGPALAADSRTGRLYVAATIAGHVLEWTSLDGRRWSRAHVVNAPAPASQPQLSIGTDGVVRTFLFAGRSSIAPYLATSRPGLAGRAPAASRLTQGFPLTAGFGAAKGHPGGFVGDYQGLATSGRSTVAIWNDGRSGHLELTSALMAS
jgi:hypothetical protein